MVQPISSEISNALFTFASTTRTPSMASAHASMYALIALTA